MLNIPDRENVCLASEVPCVHMGMMGTDRNCRDVPGTLVRQERTGAQKMNTFIIYNTVYIVKELSELDLLQC